MEGSNWGVRMPRLQRWNTVAQKGIPGGGGGDGASIFGKAKFSEGKIWYKILNTMEKCGTKFPNNGQFKN